MESVDFTDTAHQLQLILLLSQLDVDAETAQSVYVRDSVLHREVVIVLGTSQ